MPLSTRGAKSMLHFVYGSLMSPEVLEALLGRVPALVPGSIRGYQRYRVPGQGEPSGRTRPPKGGPALP
jgi:hypothetical protein